MRRVWPRAFLLFGGALDAAFKTLHWREALAALREAQPRAKLPPVSGVPVALRWVTSPDLGFPRVPFTVWRRLRQPLATIQLFSNKVTVSGSSATQYWTAGEMYDVDFDAVPTSGASLTVTALDAHGHAIPGQQLVVTAATLGGLRAPGIAGLAVRGSGSVGPARGASQNTVANLPDWERAQRVGLPFKVGEIAPPAYLPAPQGWEPAGSDGLSAALVRLLVGGTLQLPPPATGVADIPTPAWPPPHPGRFLNSLRDPDPLAAPLRPLVALIGDCLRNTNDSNPTQIQALYEAAVSLPGIRQADIPTAAPDPAQPSDSKVPVVAVTILAAGSDTDAAAALGYGTVDFPEPRQTPAVKPVYPPGTLIGPYDYMVSAPFVLPFGGSIELAALLQMRPDPEPANGLQATRLQGNRPPVRDAPTSESVQLSWSLSALPQEWGTLVSRAPGSSVVLNPARPAGVGGFDLYTPLRPDPVDGQPPVDARTAFTDAVSPVPLSGSAVSRYLVIGRDPFGRWTPWRLVPSTSTAPPVQMPGLFHAELQTNVAGRIGRIVPAYLVVTLAWDWTDRSPARIEVFGTFMSPTGLPPVTPAPGMPPTPSAPVVISFDAAGNPSITSGHPGSVALAPDPGPPHPDHRRYTLTLTKISCDYTAAREVAFAVWARAAEKVRPTVNSDYTAPVVARMPDPIPPDPPTLPPVDILWTALPDATNRARAVLHWPAVPNASGYHVWEATEAALRHAVDAAAVPTPGHTLLQRAVALRTLVDGSPGSQDRSLFAFSRLHDRPVTATELEVTLPGSSDSLYAYRVSAVTPANIESPRSAGMAFVAVPRRVVPLRPNLLVRTVAGPSGGVEVIALPVRGTPPAGFRVHRVRRLGLASDVGMMGPPVYDETAPGWAPTTVPRSPGSADVDQGFSLVDPVPYSWYPYHYKVVAIGAGDPTNGALPGESPASATATGVRLPTAPPLLDNVNISVTQILKVITFRTDLPVRATPVGSAQITILQLLPLGGPGARLERVALFRVDPKSVAVGPLPPPTSLAPVIRRSAPDALGRCTYWARTAGLVGGVIVVVTDPLARATERAFPEVH